MRQAVVQSLSAQMCLLRNSLALVVRPKHTFEGKQKTAEGLSERNHEKNQYLGVELPLGTK